MASEAPASTPNTPALRDPLHLSLRHLPRQADREPLHDITSRIDDWLGDSVWRAPELEISRIKSCAPITVVSYHRGTGESVWQGDRHRLVLQLDQ